MVLEGNGFALITFMLIRKKFKNKHTLTGSDLWLPSQNAACKKNPTCLGNWQQIVKVNKGVWQVFWIINTQKHTRMVSFLYTINNHLGNVISQQTLL
jgi:hypothetical protein